MLARAPAAPLQFARMPFAHPLYVMFSSGTTGMPKCIVHSAGGTLLKHLMRAALHSDLKEGDRLFYFTTLGWMMWNWLVSGLASGATLLLYDGSPFHPDRQHPVGLRAGRELHALRHVGQVHRCAEEGGAGAGQDARPVQRCARCSRPARRWRRRASTTSTRPSSADLHLASISGGTELLVLLSELLKKPRRPLDIREEKGHSALGQSGHTVKGTTQESRATAATGGRWPAPAAGRLHAVGVDERIRR